MNILLFEPQEVRDNLLVVSGRRARHIRKILRLSPGDTMRVGAINGPVGTGVIQAVGSDHVAMTITLEPRAARVVEPLDLILAVPRPIMLRRVLAQAASMGVRRIFLTNARRVEKSYFKASALSDEAIREALRSGLEQAVDTVVPEVSIHHRFRPFAEDVLPAYAANTSHRLLAHPGASSPLWEVYPPQAQKEPVILAIGPEGGWVDFEVELLVGNGFLPFTIGSRILRVDTVVPALLAQVQLLRRLPSCRAGR